LNGLWIAGALRVEGDLRAFNLRHCTLAPGLGVDDAGFVIRAPDHHLAIAARRIEVTLQNCILPPLRVGHDAVRVRLRNCIIDAGAPDKFALSNLAANGPAGSWRIENCTIIGRLALDRLELASNSILFGDSVTVRRRQEGCVRFTWLPNNPDTRVPRRHHCLPADGGANANVRPHFTSLQICAPSYGQLSGRCPAAIRTGADDGAEMGAFHDLFQAQREAHLRARVTEYLRLGLEAGVFHES
jgi:hypothetical protein